MRPKKTEGVREGGDALGGATDQPKSGGLTGWLGSSSSFRLQLDDIFAAIKAKRQMKEGDPMQ